METYLLQLDLIDGAGRHDQTKYYLIDCKTYPVDHCKLDDDVLEELRKLYPNDNKIHNSGYHDWSVVSLGSRSIMERVYQQYQDTTASMKSLKRFGFLFQQTDKYLDMIAKYFNIEVARTNRYCYVNAVQDGERIGKVCVDLDSDDSVRYSREFGGKFAKLILISTSPSHCGQGIATALMNRTIQELKDYNLYLNVIPLTRNESDKDKNQLIRFYSKFGFKIYEPDICTTTMVRLRES